MCIECTSACNSPLDQRGRGGEGTGGGEEIARKPSFPKDIKREERRGEGWCCAAQQFNLSPSHQEFFFAAAGFKEAQRERRRFVFYRITIYQIRRVSKKPASMTIHRGWIRQIERVGRREWEGGGEQRRKKIR